MKKINLLSIFIISLVFASCEPKYEKEYNWAYPVCGDWMVKVYVHDTVNDKDTVFAGPLEMKTYNSAFGQDSIWIDDYPVYYSSDDRYIGNFWTLQVKAAVDMKSLTFQSDSAISVVPDYPVAIKVLNGKVINKDSIYFELQFDDDGYYDENGDWVSTPFETTYKIAGHRETSYEEYMQQ
jgi:hypothetical protein